MKIPVQLGFDFGVSDLRIQAIADELIGTAKSLHDVLEDNEDQSEIETRLSDKAFCCDCCGWWADVEELNNENEVFDELCDECAGDQG